MHSFLSRSILSYQARCAAPECPRPETAAKVIERRRAWELLVRLRRNRHAAALNGLQDFAAPPPEQYLADGVTQFFRMVAIPVA